MSDPELHSPEQESQREWRRLSGKPENFHDLVTVRPADIPGDAKTKKEWLDNNFPNKWRFNEAEFAERNTQELADIEFRGDLNTEGLRNLVKTGRKETDEGVSLQGVNRYLSSIRMGYVEVTDDPLMSDQEK